jgi:hypothetical protein
MKGCFLGIFSCSILQLYMRRKRIDLSKRSFECFLLILMIGILDWLKKVNFYVNNAITSFSVNFNIDKLNKEF